MTSGSIQSTSSSVSASPPARTTTPPASKSVLPTASTAPSSVATNFDDDYNEWELGIGDLIIDLDADIEKNNSQPNGSASSSPLTEISRPMEAQTPSQPEMRHMSTCTSVGTVTEPDCLGPCEPGTSVTLEGIVWQETEGGVLVVNVTWRGKTYVGTLLDCTKHDWAPPRFCESPTSDIEAKANKSSRAKRGRTSVDLRSVQSKLRNGKGRRTANSSFTVPASPVKCEAPASVNGKRKSRPDLELSPVPESAKNGKRNRSQSRNTPTPNVYSSEPTTPTMHAPPSLALIECPEPNCSKKYKHINGLKYHQTRAHSGLSEPTSKTETDSTDLEPNKDSVLPSDSEEATTEASSVPPSPSSKNTPKSGTNSESASDPSEANRNNNSDSVNQESSVTFQPICDPKTANSSAGSPMSDDLNDTPMDSRYSPTSPFHGSTAVTTSNSISSGLATSTSSHNTSSTPSATFLVPSSGSQGNLSSSGPLKPLPSKPISVDFANSQSDNAKRKKSKHKKKKKDKDRERDRDKDKKSKHPEGSSEGVPGIKLKVVGYPMDTSTSSDCTGQTPSDQVPMDTSPSGNSCGSPVDNANSDACNIENVQSPAYSDISDANDTETELKPSGKSEEPVVPATSTSSDASSKSASNNFGIYPFFNQTPYILPVGATSGDKTASPQPYSDKQNQDPSPQSQSSSNQPSTVSSSKSSLSSSSSQSSSASLSSQPSSSLLPSQSSVQQQSSQQSTRNSSPPSIVNQQQTSQHQSQQQPQSQSHQPQPQLPQPSSRTQPQPQPQPQLQTQPQPQHQHQHQQQQQQQQQHQHHQQQQQQQHHQPHQQHQHQQKQQSTSSSSTSTQQNQSVNSSDSKKNESSRSSGPTDPRRPREIIDSNDKKRDDKCSSRNQTSSSTPPNNHGPSSTLSNTNPPTGPEYGSPLQGSLPYPYGFMPGYPGYSLDPAYQMHLLANDPHYKHQYERVSAEHERMYKEQHLKMSDKGDLKEQSQLASNDKRQSPACMGLDLATKSSSLAPQGDLRITPTSKVDAMLITNIPSKDKMDLDNRGILKDNHDITVEPQLIKNKGGPLAGPSMMVSPANYPNSLYDSIYDKSKDDMKRFYVVDHSKNEDSSPRVPSLSIPHPSGPPPLKRDDSHLHRDNKMDSMKSSSSSSSSILNIPQGSKIPMSVASNSVMSSISNASSSSISSPKNAAHHHSSNSSFSSSSSSSSKKDKSNNDDKDKNKHSKNEGVKPTMETTGPPPPPTSSYYLSSAYLQHPSAHASFATHMPFDPNHPIFRPGAMNPAVMGHPYGAPPYLHPQMRYHHGPPGSSPGLDISHFHLN